VQRLMLTGGERSWTVLGTDHHPVGPAEEFLEYLRVQRVSPNTVKSYARALALWWQYGARRVRARLNRTLSPRCDGSNVAKSTQTARQTG
jgi:site-specific recombinase XerC